MRDLRKQEAGVAYPCCKGADVDGEDRGSARLPLPIRLRIPRLQVRTSLGQHPAAQAEGRGYGGGVVGAGSGAVEGGSGEGNWEGSGEKGSGAAPAGAPAP